MRRDLRGRTLLQFGGAHESGTWGDHGTDHRRGVRGAFDLGYGFLESVYKRAMVVELILRISNSCRSRKKK